MAFHTKGESEKRWEWYRFHRIILGPPPSSVKPSNRVMCVREFRCAISRSMFWRSAARTLTLILRERLPRPARHREPL